MSKELKSKTINGVFWKGIETFFTRFSSFLVSIVLARILLPEDFGLLAMLTIFIALSSTFVNAGFAGALVQRKEISIIDECSVFYFNIAIASAVYCLLFVAAPWIARFYEQPQLVAILRVMAVGLIIGSFGQVHATLFQKRMDFKALFTLSVIANVSSGVVGVTMAYRGFGVWSLVASALISQTLRVCAIWYISSWRPRFIFCFKSLRSLFGYGSKLMLSSLLDTFFMNIYGLIIGKLYSAADLAFYNRGRSMPNLMIRSVVTTIGSVMFPALSSIQDDAVRMRAVVKKSLVTISFILWPMLIGLAVVAESFIHVVLTEKWLPSVPYLQVFCLSFALYPIHVINLQVIGSVGRSDIILKLEIIKKALLLISILITAPIGVFAMVVGRLPLGVAGVLLNSHYTKRFVNYSLGDQVKDLLPVGFVVTGMAIGVYAVGLFSYPTVLVKLIVQVLSGGVFYLGLGYLFRIEAFSNIIDLGMHFLASRAPKNSK